MYTAVRKYQCNFPWLPGLLPITSLVLIHLMHQLNFKASKDMGLHLKIVMVKLFNLGFMTDFLIHMDGEIVMRERERESIKFTDSLT